jgi:integrase
MWTWPEVNRTFGSGLTDINRSESPRAKRGERAVPLPPIVVNTLREWKRQCPKSERELVFANGDGKVEWHSNIIQRGLIPVQVAAGVTAPVLDAEGKPMFDDERQPIVTAKYTGVHALRHFYASWCINRKKDGGLELSAKMVQERMGALIHHSHAGHLRSLVPAHR